VPLLEPRDGLPPLVTTAPALAEAVAALGAGEGPVAVDAERASGYRYGHRAFLVQLRRRGAGTGPVGPVPPPRPSPVRAGLGAGEGPVAVDAERASGYRYGHRAFLVQLRRRGAGTVLIDPIACPDLSALDAVLAGSEAVLHAASQDLPCLAELGYRPRQLFDT